MKEILKSIKEDRKIVFITDVMAAVDIASVTFYKYFPFGSDDHKTIIDALNKNKVATKRIIRDRLLECNSANGLIALYKLLITDPEERAILNNKDDTQNTNNQEQEITLQVQ